MDLYSIDEVSKELNISKQTVYNKIKLKEVKPFTIKKNGVRYIKIEGLEVIKSTLKSNANQFENMNEFDNKNNDIFKQIQNDITIENIRDKEDNFKLKDDLIVQLKDEIEFLKEQITIKDKQIEIKDKQIEDSHKLIENTQILLKQSQEIALLNASNESKEIEINIKEKKSLKDRFKDLFK